MSKKKEFGSRFLYAEDLLVDGEYKSPEVVISEVHKPGTLETDQGDNSRPIDEWAISFEKATKILVLCSKTNIKLIHIVTGVSLENSDAWIGKKIKLGVRIVPAFGAEEPAIRVLPPIGTKLRRGIKKHLGREAKFKK